MSSTVSIVSSTNWTNHSHWSPDDVELVNFNCHRIFPAERFFCDLPTTVLMTSQRWWKRQLPFKYLFFAKFQIKKGFRFYCAIKAFFGDAPIASIAAATSICRSSGLSNRYRFSLSNRDHRRCLVAKSRHKIKCFKNRWAKANASKVDSNNFHKSLLPENSRF